MRSVKKINTKGIKASDIKDSDIPLLNEINKQRVLKENKIISDKEKEQIIQDTQVRIDNDIKGCYITFNIMFYGLIILMLIPVTFLFRGMSIEEILTFYGIYAVFGRNIAILPLLVMFFTWKASNKRDSLHPSTIKMRRMFKVIFIITITLIIISLIVFGLGLKDLNF